MLQWRHQRCVHDTNETEEMVRTVQPTELKNLGGFESDSSVPSTQDRRVSCDECRQKKVCDMRYT